MVDWALWPQRIHSWFYLLQIWNTRLCCFFKLAMCIAWQNSFSFFFFLSEPWNPVRKFLVQAFGGDTTTQVGHLGEIDKLLLQCGGWGDYLAKYHFRLWQKEISSNLLPLTFSSFPPVFWVSWKWYLWIPGASHSGVSLEIFPDTSNMDIKCNGKKLKKYLFLDSLLLWS